MENEQNNQIYQLRYLVMEDFVYQDPKLTDISRRLYSFIHTYTGEKFYFSNKQLSAMFRCSIPSITRAVSLLQKLEYISVESVVKGGGGELRFIKDLRLRIINGDYPSSSSVISPYIKDNKIKEKEINKEKNELPKEKESIEAVWEHYISVSRTRETLLPGRKDKIRLRLKTFTPEQLFRAVDHFFADSFWKHLNCDYLFRSDENVDKILNLKPRTDHPGGNYLTEEQILKIVTE